RLDIRLTPDTPVAAVTAILDETVAAHGLANPGINFRVEKSVTPPSYTKPDEAILKWLLAILAAESGFEPVAMPLLGGTLPVWVFTETLGIPCYWLPAANSDNNQHDVNEHFILRHFFQQTEVYR